MCLLQLQQRAGGGQGPRAPQPLRQHLGPLRKAQPEWHPLHHHRARRWASLLVPAPPLRPAACQHMHLQEQAGMSSIFDLHKRRLLVSEHQHTQRACGGQPSTTRQCWLSAVTRGHSLARKPVRSGSRSWSATSVKLSCSSKTAARSMETRLSRLVDLWTAPLSLKWLSNPSSSPEANNSASPAFQCRIEQSSCISSNRYDPTYPSR